MTKSEILEILRVLEAEVEKLKVAEEEKHASWECWLIHRGERHYCCSACGFESPWLLARYCPTCGAKMDNARKSIQGVSAREEMRDMVQHWSKGTGEWNALKRP